MRSISLLLRQPLKPRMTNGVLGCQSFLWLENQTLFEEVDEVSICCFVLKKAGDGLTSFLYYWAKWTLLWSDELVVVGWQEVVRLFVKLLIFLAGFEHWLWHSTDGDYYVLKKFIFIMCRKQRWTHHKLIGDTSQRPHIYSLVIRQTKDNFWRTIISTLDVSEPRGTACAASSKIDDLDSFIPIICENDIFRFHIAMYYTLVFHVFEALHHLQTYCAQKRIWKYLFQVLVAFHVLIQIEMQKFKNDDNVLAEFEAIEVLNYVISTFHVHSSAFFL